MNDASAAGAGHRARLRTRLLDGGPEALLDHELIEYLLALAIPRRDTKPLAKRLLAEFGGIGALLAAEPTALVRQGGLSEAAAAALKIVEAAALRMLRGRGDEEARPGQLAGAAPITCTPTWRTARSNACACCTSTPRTR